MDIATGRPRASRGVEEGGFVDRVPLDRLARTSFVVPEEPNVVRSPGLMYDHLVQRGGRDGDAPVAMVAFPCRCRQP